MRSLLFRICFNIYSYILSMFAWRNLFPAFIRYNAQNKYASLPQIWAIKRRVSIILTPSKFDLKEWEVNLTLLISLLSRSETERWELENIQTSNFNSLILSIHDSIKCYIMRQPLWTSNNVTKNGSPTQKKAQR